MGRIVFRYFYSKNCSWHSFLAVTGPILGKLCEILLSKHISSIVRTPTQPNQLLFIWHQNFCHIQGVFSTVKSDSIQEEAFITLNNYRYFCLIRHMLWNMPRNPLRNPWLQKITCNRKHLPVYSIWTSFSSKKSKPKNFVYMCISFLHFVKIDHFDLNSKWQKQSQLQFCQTQRKGWLSGLKNTMIDLFLNISLQTRLQMQQPELILDIEG